MELRQTLNFLNSETSQHNFKPNSEMASAVHQRTRFLFRNKVATRKGGGASPLVWRDGLCSFSMSQLLPKSVLSIVPQQKKRKARCRHGPSKQKEVRTSTAWHQTVQSAAQFSANGWSRNGGCVAPVNDSALQSPPSAPWVRASGLAEGKSAGFWPLTCCLADD